MLGEYLYVKRISKHFDKNGKLYYKLVLCSIISFSIPAPYDDDIYLRTGEKEYNLTVFNNSGHVIACFFCDIDRDDSFTGVPGVECPIDMNGNFLDIDFAYIVNQHLHLYNALSSNSIREGYWLCGKIIKRRVKPYTINGSTVKHYTLPMLWDSIVLTNEQKEARIIREFSWKGRTVVEGTSEDWYVEPEEDADDYRDDWRRITNADAFDDPSDYWNID